MSYSSSVEYKYGVNSCDWKKFLICILVICNDATQHISIQVTGSADKLNLFYSRFDNKDYSSIHQIQKSDLEKRKIHEAPITIAEDVYKVHKEINTNKATGPDKISGRIVKRCTTSLVYIIHSIFNISLDLCACQTYGKSVR